MFHSGQKVWFNYAVYMAMDYIAFKSCVGKLLVSTLLHKIGVPEPVWQVRWPLDQCLAQFFFK